MSTKPSSVHGIVLSELAHSVGGEIKGAANFLIAGICSVDKPVPGHISFLRSANQKQIDTIASAGVLAAVLVPDSNRQLQPSSKLSLVFVKDPQSAIVDLVPLFYCPPEVPSGVSPKADIDRSAKFGKNVSVGPFCAIGPDVVIGDEAVLHPHVTLYEGVTIGARSVIHAGAVVREYCSIGADAVIQPGAVIGADGFGYIPDPKLGLRFVPQIGTVTISDNVDIGANSCVDRATFGTTKIGQGTKLDNLVQIGHNSAVGSHSIICGMVGVGGSSEIGNQVVIGGRSGLADHVKIPDQTRIGGASIISHSISEAGDYSGTPPGPLPAIAWRRLQVLFTKLPWMYEQIKKLSGSRDQD